RLGRGVVGCARERSKTRARGRVAALRPPCRRGRRRGGCALPRARIEPALPARIGPRPPPTGGARRSRTRTVRGGRRSRGRASVGAAGGAPATGGRAAGVGTRPPQRGTLGALVARVARRAPRARSDGAHALRVGAALGARVARGPPA